MENITTAVFLSNTAPATAEAIWQYDYNRKLRIQGLHLPSAVEVHFALQETGGETVTRIGVTQDGVTDAPIPDSMLENGDITSNYDIYAWIYVADSTAGRTEHKIRIPVRSRPKPDVKDRPEDTELFREAITAVNDAADRAEAAGTAARSWAVGGTGTRDGEDADNARHYAQSAEQSATAAAEKEQSVSNTEATVNKLYNKIEELSSETSKNAENATHSAIWARNSAAAASESEQAAIEAAGRAERSESAAAESEKTATAAATTAEKSASAASSAQQKSETAQITAEKSAEAAAASERNASASETASVQSASAAAESEKTARASAAAASASEQAAATAATQTAADRQATETASEAAQQAATTATEAQQNIQASAEQIETNKTGIEALKKDKAEVNDVAVGADVWSSKHLVDMLCPEFEESGNPVQCYPVEGYPIDAKVSWTPTQEGSGDPSPDNVRPISGRDSVKIRRCAINLLDPEKNKKNTYKLYGLTITYLGENKVHLEGTYTNSNEDGSFVILDTNQAILSGRGFKMTGFLIDGSKRNYSLYGLRTSEETVIAMRVYGWKKGEEINMTIAIVVYSGDTPPTEYIPYTGQTTTLTIPQTIYGGTVDVSTGEGEETWNIAKVKNAGSISILDNTIRCNCLLPRNAMIAKTGNAIADWLPEKVDHALDMESFYTNQKMCYIKIAKTRLQEINIENINSFLAEHPLMVCYKLNVPAAITTDTQTITALSGVNTVLTDADSVTVTGRADPIKRITDLDEAVASIEIKEE